MAIISNNNRNYFRVDDEICSISGSTYELGEFIGSGGNGAVYECIDQTGSIVAVKFLLSTSSKARKRFTQEIKVLKVIDSPYIIRYYDEGITDGYDKDEKSIEIPFVIMEKADCNLVDYLNKNPNLDYELYAGQFRGLCEALAALHKVAIHRDIKPENILVKADRWILTDFGLSQMIDPTERQDITGENEKIGPRFWMSPEAITKMYFHTSEIGTYSDVYQLCLIFVFVLTRRFPGGVLLKDDIVNTTDQLKDLLLSALSNMETNRPSDGNQLLDRYNKATYEA